MILKKVLFRHCEEIMIRRFWPGKQHRDLFVVLDSWEALNMAQIDKLDKLQAILSTQVEIENNLKRNNYEQIFKI
jgi:hypothetical protein